MAAVGSLVAFLFGRTLDRLATPILLLDAAGLSLFAVSGALKGIDFGIGFGQAVILGAITAVGGGTLRDVLIRQVPSVLTSGLYAIPALVGAFIVVAADRLGASGPLAAILAASACFAIRMLGVRYDLQAPKPRASSHGAG